MRNISYSVKGDGQGESGSMNVGFNAKIDRGRDFHHHGTLHEIMR